MKFHEIRYDDMLNGDGIRCTIFFNKCSHNCSCCHNKQTWNDGGDIFKHSDFNDVLKYCFEDYVDGITLSGGDPLHIDNRDEITAFVEMFKLLLPNKTVWCYTGYTWDEVKHLEVMKYIDVLVDGKFDKRLYSPNLPWVGSSNQKIINVQESLKLNKVIELDI